MPVFNPGGASLSGTATSIAFSGSGVSSSIDANNVLQVNVSGGLPIQNATVTQGFANILNFNGTAIGGMSVVNGTGTVTVNAGAGGSINVYVTGVSLGAATAIDFKNVTGTFAAGIASITAAGGGGAPGGLTTYTTAVFLNSGKTVSNGGSFNICHDSLTTGSRVFVFQSAEFGGVGKGTRPDEAQMDLIVFKAQKVNPALTCTVHWVAATAITGAYNIDWFMG